MVRKNVKLEGIHEKLSNFRIRKADWNGGQWYNIRIYPSAAKRLSYLGYEVEKLEKVWPLYRKKRERKEKQMAMFGGK